MALRASEDDEIMSLRRLLMFVQDSLASSKSPKTSCQVWAHPEPSASLVVSTIWVKVFTLVAASSEVLARSMMALAWSSE